MIVEEMAYVIIICAFLLLPAPAVHFMFSYWLWDQHLDKRERRFVDENRNC